MEYSYHQGTLALIIMRISAQKLRLYNHSYSEHEG